MSNSIAQFSTANPQQVATDTVQQLKFQLYPDTSVMLPIEQITEVLKFQLVQIMPIPQMPSWVMGVYNWRGDILWMVDLGQLIGLDSWYQYQHDRSSSTAIVLAPNRQSRQPQIHLGLVVARVDDLENMKPQEIQAAVDAQTNSRLNSFLQGYWLKPQGEMVLALDGKEIAAAMPTANL